jgi:hypothetical protein
VCVVKEWVEEQYGNVPSLKPLPQVQKVRRAASGRGGATDPHGRVLRSGAHRDGTSVQPELEA